MLALCLGLLLAQPVTGPKDPDSDRGPDSQEPDMLMPADGRDAPSAPPNYHNPQGSIVVSGHGGVSSGAGATIFSLGVGAGYSVLHGVVPGAKGSIMFGDAFGGSLGLDLLLTPPLDFPFLPFAYGEVNHRWDPSTLKGAVLGAGGGLILGAPGGGFIGRIGWIFRRFYAGPGYDLSGPVFSFMVRF